jgi:hypothetical protein
MHGGCITIKAISETSEKNRFLQHGVRTTISKARGLTLDRIGVNPAGNRTPVAGVIECFTEDSIVFSFYQPVESVSER